MHLEYVSELQGKRLWQKINAPSGHLPAETTEVNIIKWICKEHYERAGRNASGNVWNGFNYYGADFNWVSLLLISQYKDDANTKPSNVVVNLLVHQLLPFNLGQISTILTKVSGDFLQSFQENCRIALKQTTTVWFLFIWSAIKIICRIYVYYK